MSAPLVVNGPVGAFHIATERRWGVIRSCAPRVRVLDHGLLQTRNGRSNPTMRLELRSCLDVSNRTSSPQQSRDLFPQFSRSDPPSTRLVHGETASSLLGCNKAARYHLRGSSQNLF